MDDYYSIIGVDAGASVDDIRAAYRDRKDALSAMEGGTAKADAAQLNKAWNVLSDPYQRGRYDEQRAQSMENGALDDDDDADAPVDASTNGGRRAPAKSNAKQQNPRKRSRDLGPPTIPAPPGTRYPTTKERLLALGTDLLVIVVLFVATQFLVVTLEKSQQKAAYNAKQELVNHTIPDDKKTQDNAKKDLDNANKANSADKPQKQTAYDAATKKVDDDNKQLDSANNKLNPIEMTVTLIFFAIALLYLVIPSALTGRTFGKKMQHLRAVRQDGSPLGWTGALMRYGSLVIITYLLSFLLGPIAAVIVLFGVTMWMRNANQQGIHDRLFHTIVVRDAE